jgi:carbonic anhydrase
MVDKLLAHNRAWAEGIRASDPDYFPRLAQRQAPEYFWLGCADSRVPTNVVVGLEPGEIFVHRSVANVVHATDMSLLAALEYAVDVLAIDKIIVCGHYGCGGIKAATEDELHGLADHWLEPVRRLARTHADELDRIGDIDARRDRLAELNVVSAVHRLTDTPILRRAWQRGRDVWIHGLIYRLHDGLLEELHCSQGPTASPD